MKPAQTQIIGGGLIGLSTAYALLRRGAKHVRVIEAREAIGLETSFANAGMVHASLANPWNGPGVGGQLLRSLYQRNSPMKLRLSSLPSLVKWGGQFLKKSAAAPHWHATLHNYQLARYSVELNRQWRQELAIDDGYCGDGLLKIFRSKEEFLSAKIDAKKLQDLGLETKYLTPAQACEKEPALIPIQGQFVGAIYYPTDFKADAYGFSQSLAAEIIKLGGEIMVEANVEKFVCEGDRVVGVQTNAGKLLAETTIVCAGARSRELLKPLGIDLNLRPVKGYSLGFDKRHFTGAYTLPKIPIVDDSLHAAITPLGGLIRIAGTAELAGYNSTMPKARLLPLLDMLEKIYPEIANGLTLEDANAWHGFRPVSADGLPFIGLVKVGGLAVNTGHAHMGWTMCAGAGAMLADIVLGKQPEIKADVFDPQR